MGHVQRPPSTTGPPLPPGITGLGTDGWGHASLIRIDAGGAFAFEIISTALFVFVVLRVTSATANAATAAIAIGLALTVGHLIGIPVTGTSVNPARSLGPALVVGGSAMSQVWLFIVAPLGGGAPANADTAAAADGQGGSSPAEDDLRTEPY